MSLVRHTWARRLALALLGAQLALGAVAVGAWRFGSGGGSDSSDLLAAAVPAARPTSIESALVAAEPVARRWRSDAEVLSATLQIDWPWEVGEGAPPVAEGGWATIVYASAGGDGGAEPATLSVVIERLSGAAVRVEELGWEKRPAVEAAAVTTYPTTSVEAVVAAEGAGGTGFRRGCPAERHLTRVSLVRAPVGERTAPPYWLVTYQDTRQPERNALEVHVDAVSGEVVRMRDRSLACEE